MGGWGEVTLSVSVEPHQQDHAWGGVSLSVSVQPHQQDHAWGGGRDVSLSVAVGARPGGRAVDM